MLVLYGLLVNTTLYVQMLFLLWNVKYMALRNVLYISVVAAVVMKVVVWGFLFFFCRDDFSLVLDALGEEIFPFFFFFLSLFFFCIATITFATCLLSYLLRYVVCKHCMRDFNY